MQLTIHRTPLAVWATVLLALLTSFATGASAAPKAIPLTQKDLIELLKSGMPSRQVSKTVDDRGIDFDLTPDVEQRVRRAGATDDVVAALRRASQGRWENGQPQNGVLVIKTCPGESEIYLDDDLKGKSNHEGEFRLPDLRPGTYRLRVSLPGFQDYEKASTVAAGDEQAVFVNLLQKPAPTTTNIPPAGHKPPAANCILPVPGAKLSPVLFYEGPVDLTLDKSEREYRSGFDRFTTRAVYWELDLNYPPPGSRIEFQIDITWYRPDGTEMDRQTVSAYVQPDWGTSWETLGFGYAEPGHWMPGTYRVEMFFKKAHIAGGTFQIN